LVAKDADAAIAVGSLIEISCRDAETGVTVVIVAACAYAHGIAGDAKKILKIEAGKALYADRICVVEYNAAVAGGRLGLNKDQENGE
jgi:hypothetical protein